MNLIADKDGERLDAFLARSETGLSRSAAQKLLEEGCVTCNGKPGKKNDRLSAGDTVSVTLPEPKEIDVAAKEIPLDIVYEDEDVVVINKPKGLVVHPAPGHQDDTLVNGLLYALGTACPASTESCGLALSTGSIRIPPACWPWQRMTWPTRCWLPSWWIIPWPGLTRPSSAVQ